MNLLSKSGSFWRCSMMSWHICMWHFFWRSFSSLGTIFAQTFRMPKSLVIIFQTLSFFMSIWRAIIWTVNRRSPRTICFTCSKFTSVLLVEGFSLRKSSSTSLRPSLNLLCHSKTCVCDLALSPYTRLSISSVCDRVFPKQIKNFRMVRS